MSRRLGVGDLEVAGRRVLVRVDLNVPIEDGEITDDTRIRGAVPTIEHLRARGARVVLASHRGRPNGARVPELSLKTVAERLSALLGIPVALAGDCVGPGAETAVGRLEDGDVLLLENLRFHHGEEANDDGFAAQLASLADAYVNDAFGAAHRAHASTDKLATLLHPGAAGLLMQSELQHLSGMLERPDRPFLAVLGGAKVSDKIAVISRLLDVSDGILIGGAMAYTFLVAMGRHVGDSLVEREKVHVAADLLKQALDLGKPLHLPIDHVTTQEFSADADTRVAHRDTIEDGWQALDIGPATSVMYAQLLGRAKTVVWNGPLGVYELEPFAHGTIGVAKALSTLDATTVIGGGDCVAAVEMAGVADKMTHISTGGGASLEFLEGKELPGVAALCEVE